MFSLIPSVVESAIPDTRGLLDRARDGDADSFGEVCRAYETRLLRQAVALCGDACLAEDLAQDTLVEAWKSLRRYDGRCQFFTWLCAILLNRYRNTIRRKRWLIFFNFTTADKGEFQRRLSQIVDHEPLPDQSALQRDQEALIWKCIRTLPLKQQQVVHLRFYVDDSLDGIAAALGCSVGTVKSRLFHALENLRAMNALRDQFIPDKPKPDTL